ncbi:MAG: DUF4249 domain-containing protein [Nonlabens sp.]
MKRLYILMVALVFLGCEDVIELDLNEVAPRLVIDAAFERDGNTGESNILVVLTRSTGFYQETNPAVVDAQVTVTDAMGNVYDFTSNELGFYRSNLRFEIEDGMDYTLRIIDGIDEYVATERLVTTVPLFDVEQALIEGIDDDLIKITAYFNDPPGLGNAYLFSYIDERNLQIDAFDDEFSDGNRSSTIFFLESEEIGTTARLRIQGIDQVALQFYEALIEQTGDSGTGPFATPPANARGNIINIASPDRFPFGYFRVSQTYAINYDIQ